MKKKSPKKESAVFVQLTAVDAAKPPHTNDSQVDNGLDGEDMVGRMKEG